MTKKALYILGIITLVGFPLPTFIGLYFLEDIHWLEILQLDRLTMYNSLLGLGLGAIYAFLALLLMRASVFDSLPDRIETIVANMNLSLFDAFFISVCAGVGEELLFRSGVQFYLGPITTSVLFVAIHGYLNPMNWKMSLYGLIVLPFIILISYGFIQFGLWFAITAHFVYDFILFLAMSKERNESVHNDL